MLSRVQVSDSLVTNLILTEKTRSIRYKLRLAILTIFLETILKVRERGMIK